MIPPSDSFLLSAAALVGVLYILLLLYIQLVLPPITITCALTTASTCTPNSISYFSVTISSTLPFSVASDYVPLLGVDYSFIVHFLVIITIVTTYTYFPLVLVFVFFLSLLLLITLLLIPLLWISHLYYINELLESKNYITSL